jgi:hypothetical protein
MPVFAEILSNGGFNLGVSLDDIVFGEVFGAIGRAFQVGLGDVARQQRDITI